MMKNLMENSSDKCLERAMVCMFENVLSGRGDLSFELPARALNDDRVQALLRYGLFCEHIVD